MSNLVVLSFTSSAGGQNAIALDATLHETHEVTSLITTHRVENGSNITDNVIPQPRTFELTGIVTNTPSDTPPEPSEGVVATHQTNQAQVITQGSQLLNVNWSTLMFSAEFDRVKRVYGDLVDAALAGALFDVTTVLQSYSNMMISNFSVPRDVNFGSIDGKSNSMQIGITFQQVVLVDTQTTEALPGALAAKHRGQKPVKPLVAPAQQGDIDILSKIVGTLGSLF